MMPWKKRRGNTSYLDELFRENRDFLEIYLEEAWDHRDRESIIKDFKDDPFAGLTIVKDYIENKRNPQTNRDKLKKLLLMPETGLIIVSGSKGSGKTYFAFDLIQEMSSLYRPVWIGPPISLPDWMAYSPDIGGLRQGDLAVIDEANNALNARRSQSSKNVSTMERIPTLRHAGIRVVAITQTTTGTDIGLIRYADIHVKKEYTALYGELTERFGMDIYDKYMNIGMKDWNLVKSKHWKAMVLGRKLDWYDDAIGKPYSLFENKQQGTMFLASMIDEGLDAYTIATEMNMRGCPKPKKEWEKIIKTYNATGMYRESDTKNILELAGVKNPGGHKKVKA